MAAAIAALLAVALWPTASRRLSRAVDALIGAIENEDVDAAGAMLADDFRFRGRSEIGAGDRARAIERLARLARETDRVRFSEIERRVDAESGEVIYRAGVRAASGYGPVVERVDVRLRFTPRDGGLALSEAEFLTAEPRSR